MKDGEVLDAVLTIDRRGWNQAFRRALRRGNLLEIEREDGEILAINPQQVSFARYRDEAASVKVHDPRRSLAGVPAIGAPPRVRRGLVSRVRNWLSESGRTRTASPAAGFHAPSDETARRTAVSRPPRLTAADRLPDRPRPPR